MNLLLFPTLLLALVFFVVGTRSTRHRISIAMALAVVVSVPGLLMVLYYLHLFDNAAWYYEFRSWPYIELSAAGLGFLFGALVGLAKKPKPLSVVLSLVTLVLVLAIPYVKPILRPLPMSSFQDRWTDSVCLQSTPSSCGAASAASVLRQLGKDATEMELARECCTYRGGTENWYLARALRRRGCSVRFRVEDGLPKGAHLPMIAGVRVRKFGHFIAILGKSRGTYVCADPLVGLERVPEAEIVKRFNFTGFFMEVEKISR